LDLVGAALETTEAEPMTQHDCAAARGLAVLATKLAIRFPEVLEELLHDHDLDGRLFESEKTVLEALHDAKVRAA
jgi:hypothetical protein